LKKHVIDGNSSIINKATFDQKVDEHEFQVNEVYALDVIISSGEGKPKETEYRSTVFKRALEKTYSLKLKASRAFYAEAVEKYPTLNFSLRSFEDETNAKLGVSEALKHDLFHAYPVLTEKAGEFVAQFTFTMVILKNGSQHITGLPVDEGVLKTENKVTDQDVLKILSTSTDYKDQKKEKKKTTGTKEEETKKP